MNENQEELAQNKVFLGGSCNPTTWRQDIAIPFLEAHDITFYNPQVEEWRPELIAVEQIAKEKADVLFFVIDTMTRGTASMVEAAYLAGCGRSLVLIMPGRGQEKNVAGEKLTDSEFEDLLRSEHFLRNFVTQQGIPVYRDIGEALKKTASLLRRTHSQDNNLEEMPVPVGCSFIKPDPDPCLKIREVFSSMDPNGNGELTFEELRLAYRALIGVELEEDLAGSDLLVEGGGRGESMRTYTFADFCRIVKNVKNQKRSMWRRMLLALSRLPNECLSPRLKASCSNVEAAQRDVFLGGNCGTSTWRKQIAIPLLQQKGVTYYDPQMSEWSERYIPLENAVKESCRVLLFVITDVTRGVASLLEAGHYIGLGCRVVLCLKNITATNLLSDQQVNDNAVRDYNRARSYLCDLAQREGTPVFNDVTAAVKCVIAMTTC